MKGTFSALDVAAIVYELNQTIKMAWVDNIYQLTAPTPLFLFKLRKESVYNLLVEPGRRIHLTSYIREKPCHPPPFCMALRKYLRGSRLTEILQHDFDRIVLLRFSTKAQEDYTLVIELFREGNVILVGPDEKIRVAYRYKRMKDRNVIVGEKFVPPPSRGLDIFSVTSEELYVRLRESRKKDIVRAFISTINVDPHLIEEALLRCNIPKEAPVDAVTIKNIIEVVECLKTLINSVRNGEISPHIILEDGSPVGFEPLELKLFEGKEKKRFGSFNEAVDEYFVKTEQELLRREKLGEIENEREKLLEILRTQEQRLVSLEREAERLVRMGNLIFMHKEIIERIIGAIKNARNKGYEWNEIISRIEEGKKRGISDALIIKDVRPQEAKIILVLDGENVSIDIRKSVPENASVYYEKAKKLSEKIEGLKKSMSEIKEKLNQLETKAELEVKIAEEKIIKARPKKWFEKFRWFESSDGFIVIAGRDAKQNEALVRKYLEKGDIFVHADIEGAPHVIVKTGGRKLPESTILEAAQFAVSYSKAWKIGFGSIDAYWVNAEQVSLSPPSGQYLKHGAVMVRGKRNYISNVPLKLSLGLVKDQGFWMLIYGPPSAITRKTNIWITLIPGKIPKNDICRMLLRKLLNKLPEEERKLASKYVTIEDLQRTVPGDSEILEESQS
ncbi:MAG: ribosome rescue protein RqcH [Candidatus Baldrarchaeia archaeon]